MASFPEFGPLQREEASAFVTGRALRIRFEEPESCPFLRDVLQTVKNGTLQERLCALDDLAYAMPLPTISEDGEKAVGAAVYILEQGVLPVLLEGLERAAYNTDWLEVEHDPNSPLKLQLRGKPHIYCTVLERLVHDRRSTSYILKHAPNLFETLRKLYSIKTLPFPHLSVAATKTMVVGVRDCILGVLIHLLKWSVKARKRLARLGTFVKSILQSALEHFASEEHLDNALRLAVLVCTAMEAPTFDKLADQCADLAAKVLAESQSRHHIEVVLLLLGKLSNYHFETFSTKFIANNLIVISTFAIAQCPPIQPVERSLIFAILRSSVKRRLGVVVDREGFQSMMLTSQSFSPEELSVLAEVVFSGMGSFHERVAAIRQVYEQQPESSLDGDRGVGRASSSSEGTEQEERFFERPPRKCAAAGCQSFETRSGEFQLCSRCKLTAYCSRDCQVKAWKAGHKAVCNK